MYDAVLVPTSGLQSCAQPVAGQVIAAHPVLHDLRKASCRYFAESNGAQMRPSRGRWRIWKQHTPAQVGDGLPTGIWTAGPNGLRSRRASSAPCASTTARCGIAAPPRSR